MAWVRPTTSFSLQLVIRHPLSIFATLATTSIIETQIKSSRIMLLIKHAVFRPKTDRK